MFVMPWLPPLILLLRKIRDSRNSSFGLGVKANLDFLWNSTWRRVTPGVEKGGEEGEKEGDSLVSPPSPLPFPSIHLSRRLVGRPRFLYPSHDALRFTIFCATVMQSRDSGCIFTVLLHVIHVP